MAEKEETSDPNKDDDDELDALLDSEYCGRFIHDFNSCRSGLRLMTVN